MKESVSSFEGCCLGNQGGTSHSKRLNEEQETLCILEGFVEIKVKEPFLV